MKHFYLSRIFSAALLAGLFMTQSASAQQKEYTDGVFMLNEGQFGKERATSISLTATALGSIACLSQ